MILETDELKLFNVYFPKQTHTDIKTQAARLGVSMNQLIVNVMEGWLKRVDIHQEEYARSVQDESSMSGEPNE
jgi:hypothetical protein